MPSPRESISLALPWRKLPHDVSLYAEASRTLPVRSRPRATSVRSSVLQPAVTGRTAIQLLHTVPSLSKLLRELKRSTPLMGVQVQISSGECLVSDGGLARTQSASPADSPRSQEPSGSPRFRDARVQKTCLQSVERGLEAVRQVPTFPVFRTKWPDCPELLQDLRSRFQGFFLQ